MSASFSAITAAGHTPFRIRHPKASRGIAMFLHWSVLILSVLLIIYISIDTFKRIEFLEDYNYMTFQLCVCIFFIIDFFVEWWLAKDKWTYFKHRLVFLILSIPYLNLITLYNIPLSHDALFFVRFIPLARGALALSIVIGYLSSNAVTSLFMSYLSIMILVVYFCSLIFFQREHAVNPDVKTYWTALWWSAMNMSTVGCYINPMTVAGKIVAVVLPIAGMIIFPLFTVYLTDYVTRNNRRSYIDPTGYSDSPSTNTTDSISATSEDSQKKS